MPISRDRPTKPETKGPGDAKESKAASKARGEEEPGREPRTC